MMKRALSCLMVIVMIVCLSATVTAKDPFYSPSGEDYWDVYVDTSAGGIAYADPTPVKKGEPVVLDAYPDSGFTFGYWTITGDFIWVEGDANSAHAIIRPNGPVEIHANFIGKGAEKDTSPVSPKTGYNTEAIIFAVAAVVMISGAAVVYTGKKYFTEK